MKVDIENITIGINMDRHSHVCEWNEKVKKFDKRVYCAYDYADGFYKVYKSMPFALWGKLGDFDGKGYYLFTIKTSDGKPRLPHIKDIWKLRSMAVVNPSYTVRKQSGWEKYYVAD